MTDRKEKIILLGGGGHAKVLIELIKVTGRFEIAGILDLRFERGETIDNIEVLGGDELLPDLQSKGIRNVCIAVGSVKDNAKRKALYGKVKELGFAVPVLIHPKSIVAGGVKLGEGVQIMAGAILQPGVAIGENSIVNTGVIIDHDCSLGSHVHVCPGVVLSGEVRIGDDAFVGAGSTIIQSVKIGTGALVGAGAVVVRDVAGNARVVGVPAR